MKHGSNEGTRNHFFLANVAERAERDTLKRYHIYEVPLRCLGKNDFKYPNFKRVPRPEKILENYRIVF